MTTTTQAPKLKPPHYASEENFRRFEDVIRNIVSSYPNPVSYVSAPLSPTTATARLRDALNSVILNRWTTNIDIDRLEFIKPNIQVIQTEHGFSVIQRKKANLAPIVSGTDDTHLNLTPECLEAFCLLLHHRLVKPFMTNITTETAFNLSTRYDITFEPIKDSNLIKLY